MNQEQSTENLADVISRGLFGFGTAAKTLENLYISKEWDANKPNSAGLFPLQALLMQTGEIAAYEFLAEKGALFTPQIMEFARTRFKRRQDVLKYFEFMCLSQSTQVNPTNKKAKKIKV